MPSFPLDTDHTRLSIDTIRLLAADCVEKAGSGHPGTPMEAAPIAYLLYTRHLRHNPANPLWPGRDRFVLSCGHASALLYSMLHLTGYDLELEDLKNFRQLNSRTPGHPEYGHTPGVETTTGPLGQGLGVSLGMAMGGRFLRDRIDRELFDYRIFVLCSDGDMMEGVSSEVASLAGHLRLGNLNLIYLDNRITIEGDTDLAFSEDVGTRFLAYDWHVQRIDGESVQEIDKALERARTETRPSLIVARTHIGFGAPGKQGTAAAHGSPLGPEELGAARRAFGFDKEESFVIPQSVAREMGRCREYGAELEKGWQGLLERKMKQNTDLADWQEMQQGRLPDSWEADLPGFTPEDGPIATRKASGRILNALAESLPFFLGGSADLAPSNNTEINEETSFGPEQSGRNLHFGVREHAMGAALNGLAHTPGLVPFGATFLIFSDYMRPPTRLAAMMGLAPVYIFTHDSIGVGEDGPTHQPVEQLAALRAIPNLQVIRPADANETVEAWKMAIRDRQGPTALILSRQSLPILDRSRLGSSALASRGGYVLAEEHGPLQLILIASGSEVHPALTARDMLQKNGIGTRVVSMPCQEAFLGQSENYQQEVLPAACSCRLAIEAAASLGWDRFVTSRGEVLAMEGFGASAPGEELMDHFGFTPGAIAEKARRMIDAFTPDQPNI